MINRDAVLELLTKVVAEKGETHSAVCEYTIDGHTPVCIAGTVVFEAAGEDGLNYLTPGTVKDEENVQALIELNFAEDAIDTLRVAQYVQDSGASWGTALEYAREFDAMPYGGQSFNDFIEAVDQRATQDREAREEAEGNAE
jgi:hypothetical protein